MNVLGLIPARGGSKAIPRKNIVDLAGKPLLGYTCQAALECHTLTRVILNTDDEEIAAVGRSYGVAAPFLRPESLAADETPILPVIQHTLAWLVEQAGFETDIVVLLQPTSPLRKAEHIDEAVQLMLDSEADTVVSVVAVPHNFNPVSVMRQEENGWLVPFMPGEMILRRQEKPRVFARNGPAILAVRRAVLEAGDLYGHKIMPYEMDRVASIDIDEPSDLALAAFWIQHPIASALGEDHNG
jgi:CMP-N-acetylneuraminic acid synthetase